MKWRGRKGSDNVEDRRGQGGGFGFPGGGRGMRFPMPRSRGGQGGGIGIVGILVILGLMYFLGVDPRVIMQGGPQSGVPDMQMPRGPAQAKPGARYRAKAHQVALRNRNKPTTTAASLSP